MKLKILSLVALLFLLKLFGIAQDIQETKIIVTEKDKQLLQEKFDKFSKDKILPIGDILINVGKDFIGTPYVAKTLDINTDESLIINLRELDCTTFVETTLALARVIKRKEMDYNRYAHELEKIRYKNGRCDGYTSRLHYFSTWIIDNQSKRVIDNVTSQCGGVLYQINIWFMSRNPQLYPQLQKNPKLIKEIANIEKEITGRDFFYIPKEKVAANEAKIKNGDIVAFTSSTKGLDIAHVGLLFLKEGHVYLLHASSISNKVEATEKPLTTILNENKNFTGIMVVRPKD
jgi:hypothetical protein